MHRLLTTLFTCTLTLSLTAPALGVDYIYDDGDGNSNVGPPSSFPSDPEMGWGNYFTAQPGGEVITEISFAMGPSFPAVRDVHVALFDDPDDDMDPRNATLLTTATIDPEFSNDTFNTVAITPSQVSGGFFVLVFAWAEAGEDAPARQDTSFTQDVSWLIYNPVEDGVDLDNLGNNAFIELANDFTFFQGVWMIRAVGEPIGTACPADLTDDGTNNEPDGVVNLFDLLALIDNWGTSGPGADISSEGGGSAVVDLFDLLDMLDAWGGCK